MTITTENGYVFVPRADWGARHSAGRSPMPAQVDEIYFHHTVTRPSGDPCADMRSVESVLHQRGLAPGYSFVFHPSGVVLEGAGFNKGAHTDGHNSRGYGFSFIGNYDEQPLTLAQLIAASRTVNLLRLSGRLAPDLAKIAMKFHREIKPTACPGAHAVNVGDGRSVKDWVRWFAAHPPE